MSKTQTELVATKARLTAAADEAIRQARTSPSAETREAARQASAELSAWLAANDLLPRARGYASRAGRRQAAERRAVERRR